MTFLRDPVDLAWLREAHLPAEAPAVFGCAVVYGNADCPERIELFAAPDPRFDDRPIWQGPSKHTREEAR